MSCNHTICKNHSDKNRTGKFLPVLFLLIITLVISSGCCQGRRHEWPEMKLLELGLVQEPATLDPALAVDVTAGGLVAKLHAGLVRFASDKLVVEADLAENWQLSSDGLVYQFTLKENLLFSDNTPLIAKDFLQSVKRVCAPSSLSQRQWVFRDIAGIQEFSKGETTEISGIAITDDQHLTITLTRPNPAFLSLLAMPNAVVVKVEKEKILGSGPYKLEEFKRGQAIILRKNPFYHQREFVQLEGIRYTLFQSATAAWAAFSAGRIDVYNIPPEQVDRFTKTAQNPDYSLQKQEKLNIYYLCFNTLLPPFDNLQIRKGINAAINRQKIVDTMLQGCAIPALGPVPPALRQNPPKTSITHDAELAKKLLSEAGITAENPLRFNLVYRASDEIARIILIIKEQLAPFHVLITPEPMEWSGMKARINSGKIALAYLNWTADYPDPRNFLFPLFHSSNAGSGGNRSFYNSAEFDQLITESETLAPGAELTAKYAQLEEKVLSDLPWVFLWHEIEYAIVKNRVNGYQIPQIYSQDRGCGINLDGTTKQ